MPQLSLSDYIDLVATTSKSIHSIVSRPESGQPEFFTNAALRSPLEELIREADPSEVGLFTVLPPPAAYHNNAETDSPATSNQIARADLPTATPLKPVSGRTAREARVKDHEPEVYANAALKYIDRYQSIQPMPRARSQAEYILEQLANVRRNIETLNRQVKQHEPVDPNIPTTSPQVLIKEEEQKIENLQTRIAELRRRKDTLESKKKPIPSFSRTKPKLASPTRKEHAEESFWNTPGPNLRGMNLTGDLLLNESVNLDDLSMASFGSPLTTRASGANPSAAAPPMQLIADDPFLEGDAAEELPPDIEEEEMGQITPTKSVSGLLVQALIPEPEPELRPAPAPQTLVGNGSQSKMRITADTEKIVVKIWATIGEILVPGVQKNAASSKAPRAKETLALLQTLSSSTAAPPSPSDTSMLSSFSLASDVPLDQPTSQQVMTAHLMLVLLSSAPNYSMSLNKIKEALATTTPNGESSSGTTHMRALYACVAKKLIKIERGKGEQVVKFDI